MRRSSTRLLLLIPLCCSVFNHLWAQTLQVALSPAPKVNRSTTGGTATIFFDSEIEDLSIVCTEETTNEPIRKINDHQWFVNIDVNKDIETDGICYRNYLLKSSSSAEYYLTTEPISPNQVLYYTINLPNELEPKLKNQEFQTKIARIPYIIDKFGISCAFDSLKLLSHEFEPLYESQKISISNQMIALANKTRRDFYLHSTFECEEAEIVNMSIAPNDNIIAAASWYAGNISIIELNNPSNVVILDNYRNIGANPSEIFFSPDSRYLWVKYGSIHNDDVEVCKWDLMNKTYNLIPINDHIKNRIQSICPIEGGILVDLLGMKNGYLIQENGNCLEINLNNEEITAMSCINDTLCCISTKKTLSVYKTNDFKKPIIDYSLDFKYIKHLVGSGSRIAALYSNDTIVVYNAVLHEKEIVEHKWDFDNVYYEGAISFNKKGDKLYALDGKYLYDLNIYTGSIRFWDHVIPLGVKINNKHGKLLTYKDKVMVSDDNIIRMYAPTTRFQPGFFGWKYDVGHGHSSHQFGGLVNQKDSLIICSVGNWDFAKNNGEYIDNVVVYFDFNKKQLGKIYGHSRRITGLYYDEKAKCVYSCSKDSVLQNYNIVTKQQTIIQLPFQPTCLVRTNSECYIGDSEGCIHKLYNGLLISTAKVHDYSVSQLIVDNKGNIFSGDIRGEMAILDSSLDVKNRRRYSNAGITSLVSDDDGNLIVGQRDGWIRVCDKDNFEIINRIKLGEQISSITLNNIGQIAVCTTKHGYSDTQSSNNTYILSSKELLLLYELSGVTVPNQLWWFSDYELVGTNGTRIFTWNLPRDIISDLNKILN